MPNPIRVLFLAGDPVRFGARVRLEDEARAIVDAVQKGSERDAFAFRPELAVRIEDLQRVIRNSRPEILHLAGHGEADRGFFLKDDRFTRKPVEKDAFANLLRRVQPPVRIVILNFCHSSEMVEVLSEVVDCTIAMNTVVRDRAAKVFSQAFYGSLAQGDTVQDAFDLALNQLDLESLGGVAAPTITFRPGADLSEPLRSRVVPVPPPEPRDAPPTGGVTIILNDATAGTIIAAPGNNNQFHKGRK
jgi:hypothetical protein